MRSRAAALDQSQLLTVNRLHRAAIEGDVDESLLGREYEVAVNRAPQHGTGCTVLGTRLLRGRRGAGSGNRARGPADREAAHRYRDQPDVTT